MDIDIVPAEEVAQLQLRSYQREMFDKAMDGNIIVAMETGSGKTHIAIARIQAELERCDPHQLVWFTSPTVALAEQQKVLMETYLSAFQVLLLVGRDQVDKWTDQRLWDDVLRNVKLVVSTPAVLKDALNHGFVRMARLALLVFDEAHRTTKNSPMNCIMKDFYHPSKAKGEQVPHILGLSASPVMSVKADGLAKIESNLDCVATTPKEHRHGLEQFVHPPAVNTVFYTKGIAASQDNRGPLCSALQCCIGHYDFASDPWIVYVKEQNDSWADRELQKFEIKKDTDSLEQLRKLLRRADVVSEQLGSLIAEQYLDTCISNYLDNNANEMQHVQDITVKERAHLVGILRRIQSSDGASSISFPAAANGNTDKAKKLISVLAQQASSNTRGIVFVEQRAMVFAMAEMLRQTPGIADQYSIGTFVGTSSFVSRKTSIAELFNRQHNDQFLRDFRDGSKNLIIATSVLEEGIDIPSCGLVVCFDATKTLIQFVQRRGRARQRDSNFVFFIDEGDFKNDPTKWQQLELVMKQAYMDEHRQVEVVTSDYEADRRLYRVASTQALLTLDTAKAHLYHFCAVSTLKAGNYIDARPEFDSTEVDKMFTATVSLPTFVHPDYRTARSSQAWSSESSAIKDAAFEAYIALHKAGLVNDNLLPLMQDYGLQPGQLDQPSIVQVSQRRDSWLSISASASQQSHAWQAYQVTLRPLFKTSTRSGSMEDFRVTLLLPAYLHSLSFKLYWNASETYQAEIAQSKSAESPVSEAKIVAAGQWTLELLRSVHGARMSSSTDFPVLIAPAEDAIGGSNSKEPDPYDRLLRIQGQTNSLYMFCRFINDETSTAPLIIVRRFPKRRDFLHPVLQKNAHTAEETFPALECAFEALPARYAILAAFMPSIMHRIDIQLLAQHLQSSSLQDVGIHSTQLIVEAISAPSAGDMFDYNRLEYLGDAILKHCAHLQVMAQHPTWPEGYLTVKKGQLVRNSTLAQAALDQGLDKYIVTKGFTGNKWRPVYVSQVLATAENRADSTRDVSSKVLADVVEALFGAAFVSGGLEKAYTCIRTLLPNETWYDHSDSFTRMLSSLPTCGHTNLNLLEELVGHRFNQPALLVEAITHASFPSYRIKTGSSYERLEFLGDSVLDLITVPKLHGHARRLRHWDLHRIHEALVNGYYLGFCCMNYGIEEATNRVNADLQVEPGARKVYLHDFIRAGRKVVGEGKRRSLEAFSQHRSKINKSITSGLTYPWAELVAAAPAKFFSDLVESVLGALYLDTLGNLAACEAFVDKLGILKYMQRILDDGVETTPPKERVGILADKESVDYIATEATDAGSGEKTFSCTVKVGDAEVVSAKGQSKAEAEVRAAVEAANLLQARQVANGSARRRKLGLASGDADERATREELDEEEDDDMPDEDSMDCEGE